MKKIFISLILTFFLPLHAHLVDHDNNELALSLYESLSSEDASNLVFSSYSIYSSLSLLYAGAAAQTAEEIAAVLHLTDSREALITQNHDWIERLITPKDAAGYRLAILNGIFLDKQETLLPSYQEMAYSQFDARVERVDFSDLKVAVPRINRWISDATEGKIFSLLDPKDVDPLTRLILINALYFEGMWARPFDPKQTKKENFHLETGETTPVDMMRQIDYFSYFSTADAEGVWLPFQVGERDQASPSCLILLPKNDSLLKKLESDQDADIVSHWMAASKQTFIDLELPKFCLNQKIPLNGVLQALGMQTAFSNGADFSGITGSSTLKLSRVDHGAYFKIDESGVVAAAATSSSIGMKSAPIKKNAIHFRADRPFLFFIIDQNAESILFMGRLSDPRVGGCP